MTKDKLLKLALHELSAHGTDNFAIETLAETTGLDAAFIRKQFPEGDEELLMDAVQYAGETWVMHLKKQIDAVSRFEDKLITAADGFALGTKEHPESLSVYIDLWKIIKDRKNGYLKKRLSDIYNFYINEFVEILEQSGECLRTKEERTAFSLIITVLSDVLHIQSVTLENKIDLTMAGSVIGELTLLFFTKKYDAI